jgi:lysophospholipase L1-like esterase
MLTRPLTGLLVVLACLAGPAVGVADALSLSSSQEQRGWIALHVAGAPGSNVQLSELRAGVSVSLSLGQLPESGLLDLPNASTWSCAAGPREFSVSDGVETATTTITTGSCSGRFTLSVRPRRPRVGRATTVRITDRWGVGDVATRVCMNISSARRAKCRSVKLVRSATFSQYRFRPSRPGRYSFSLKTPVKARSSSVDVRPRGGRLRVLAAGDSMIQLVDGFLKGRLRKVEPLKFRSDAHISTGLSKPSLLNWPRRASSTARGFKPDVTIMFIGANDGFNMPVKGRPLATCCGGAWVDEYARRARRMMRSYERRGAGSVYWLLLPAPRSGELRKIYRQVNAAVKEAASDSSSTQVIALDRTFTPGWKFRRTMRWRGRSIGVRAPDGVHLSVAGARVASDVIVRRLRRDHVIGR